MMAGQRSVPKGCVVCRTPPPFSISARAITSDVPANSVPTSAAVFARSVRSSQCSVARDAALMREASGHSLNFINRSSNVADDRIAATVSGVMVLGFTDSALDR